MKTTSDEVAPKELDQPSSDTNVKTGIYQDDEGKSNVWAIEPKMQVDENGSNFAVFAVSSTAALVTIAAITTNITTDK